MNNYGASPGERDDTSIIVIHPGRIGGNPTIGHSRLSASLVAETYWHQGLDGTLAMWDYLTEADVILCCWYVSRYGTRRERVRWKEWRAIADIKLWTPTRYAEDPAKLPPTKAEVEA